jgi:sterol desaturase/sphingolipid hydroxylase (fatty acid hydroxylase superfamily)
MLLEYFIKWNFISLFSLIASVMIGWYMLICGGLYYLLYLSSKKQNMAKWKTQLKYPDAKTVNREIVDGCVSSIAASLNVSLSVWFACRKYNNMYDDFSLYSIGYNILSLVMLWSITEVFEWYFHYLSHNNKYLWAIHKNHHMYPNPTPFSVLSDHPVDMFVKSSPLLFPIHYLTLFMWFTFINFFYGVYLHGGFEFDFLPSRYSKYLISSWHHNTHHARGKDGKNFGFFTRFCDIIFKTTQEPTSDLENK